MKKFLLMAGLMLMTSSLKANAEVDPNFYVYLCFGQSNMEGNAIPEAMDKKDVDERFKMLACVDFTNPARKKGEWYTAYPPIVRLGTGLGMADYFGRTMVANLPEDVKVGVVDVAIGGTKIEGFMQEEVGKYIASMKADEQWLKNYFAAYDNDPYQCLVDMAKIAQQSGVIKGILLHQGESNNTQKDWPNKVKLIYDRLIADLGLNAEDTPLFVGEMVSQAAGGACWGHNAVIAKVPSVIPNSFVISSANCAQKGDGLHFTAQGYRIMGQRYAQAALKVLGIEAEIQEPEQPKSDLEADQRFTSLEEIGTTPFAIINEKEAMAIFGSDNQNLKYDILANAFVSSNSGYLFRLEDSTVEGCYLLRLIKPDGDEYSIWGSPGYLNAQPLETGWCCFILGLSENNGQDMKNGAVWAIEYVDGQGFSLKNIGTGKYLKDAGNANHDEPTYFSFCTLKETTAIKAIQQSDHRQNHAVYDLNGRRVNEKALRPGIYIKDNKKVIVR